VSPGKNPFRAGKLFVHRWSKCENLTAADCAAVSLVISLIALSLLILPMVFHMLINGHIAFPKFTRSHDHVGDQSLGRSPNSLPWSRAD
jgi:hypothetical protein